MPKRPVRKSHPQVLTVLLVLLAIAVLSFLIYSVAVYERADVEESGGVFACEGGRCVLSLPDVHAEISVLNCGQDVPIPLEAGALELQHTHKQRGLIHSPHISVPADPVTRQPLVPVINTVGAFFDSIGWSLTEECVRDACNGDMCNGKAGAWKLFKNGQVHSSIRETEWVDDDVLELRFD